MKTATKSLLMLLVFTALACQVRAQGKSPTAGRAPTLPEEAKAKGFVWRTLYAEDRRLGTFADLVSRSDLIIRGRVVGERTRLSPDQHDVFTDYTVEILEVYKASGQEIASGMQLLVTRSGGNLVIDGNPVRVDTPNFPPVSWIAPHLMFLMHSTYAGEQFYFTGVSMGVIPVVQGKVVCRAPEQQRHPATKELCGKTLDEFTGLLREKLPGQTPQSRP